MIHSLSPLAPRYLALLLAAVLGPWLWAEIPADPPSPALTGATVSADPLDLQPGDTVQVEVLGQFSDGTSQDLTGSYRIGYFGADPRVLAVDGQGLVTGLRSGRSVLTVTVEDAGIPVVTSELEFRVLDPGDSDGDGLPDAYETDNGLDPDSPLDADADTDGDGLSNLNELAAGTDPRREDTDGDGLGDGLEVYQGTDPLTANPPEPVLATGLTADCRVSALNRSAPVQADGSWILPGVPANFGPTRLRATCSDGDRTYFGQSEPVEISDGGTVRAPISFEQPEPIPTRLTATVGNPSLTTVGETTQVTVTASYPDLPDEAVTTAPGVQYVSSSPRAATVSQEGLITAVSSGRILVTVTYEGVVAITSLDIVLSADSDGDGLPDDFEIAVGLDPNNPDDAFADLDGDGLATLDELDRGLDPLNPDTDDDGLDDGREVLEIGTNPVLPDTDGDGISDGLEIETGSDPLDPTSFNLEPLLAELTVTPVAVELTTNPLLGEASRRLTVIGTLIDGTVLDLTARSRGTQYTSGDLLVASFGPVDGEVFGGDPGTTTVTVAVAGVSVDIPVSVDAFTPTPVGFLGLSGRPTALALAGDLLVIANSQPFQERIEVIDVSDPAQPVRRSTFPLEQPAGMALDDDRLYLADGVRGLAILDLADPDAPRLLGRLDTAGNARDVALRGDLAYVADQTGVVVASVNNPSAPFELARIPLPGDIRSLGLEGDLLAVAAGTEGLHVLDLADPSAPVLVGSTATRVAGTSAAAAVQVRDGLAYVADGAGFRLGGLRVVDLSDPRAPTLVGSTGDDFALSGLALEGALAFASDVFFVNAVPIFGIGTVPPGVRSVLDLSSFPSRNASEGIDIEVRDGLVYLLTSPSRFSRWVPGLTIVRYARLEDFAGRPPTVRLLAPTPESSVSEGKTLTLVADAFDDVRVDRVVFRLDGEVVATDWERPYQVRRTIPVGAGPTLTVTAEAVDLGGNVGASESVEVTVLDDPTPGVRILAPTAGHRQTGGTLLPVLVEAVDDGAVAEVALLLDGAVVATTTTEPYRFDLTLPLAADSYALQARATDDLGQITLTEPLALEVEADDPPSASILEPAPGSRIRPGAVFTAVVGAADDVAVTNVDFLLDGVSAGSVTAVPYTLDLTMPVADTAVLTVAVTDSQGQVTNRDVTLTADEPPTVAVTNPADGEEVVAGSTRTVTVAADDDLGVVAVRLSLDGQPAGEDLTPPFALEVGMPSTPGPVTLVAEAEDTSGQITLSVAVNLEVIADPFVTVVGRLTFDGGAPAPAARVVCLGAEATSLADGTFEVAGVPTAEGSVRCTGSLPDPGGGVLVARSDRVPPTPVTDVGTLVLRPFRQALYPGIRLPAAGGAESVATADFDLDGVPDLLTAGDEGVLVYPGRADRSLADPVVTTLGRFFYRVAAGLLDGDGLPDAVALDLFADQAVVLSGTGNGGFAAPVVLDVGDRPAAVEIADLDGDGDRDLVIGHIGSDDVWILRNDAAGSFATAQILTLSGPVGGLSVADLDADGVPDLQVADDTSSLARFAGVGDGTFTPLPAVLVGSFARLIRVAAGQLDGVDGLDLLVADERNDRLVVLLAQPDGSFTEGPALGLGDRPTAIRIADLDHDGVPDVAGAYEQSLDRLRGPTFTERQTFALGTNVAELLDLDLDGDGVVDLVTANEGSQDLTLLYGEADGTLSNQSRQAAGLAPLDLTAVDLNLDGAVDLVSANNFERSLSVVLGRGDGRFNSAREVLTDGFGLRVIAGDWNGDGLPDVALLNESDTVELFFGDGLGDLTPGPRLTGGACAGDLGGFDTELDGHPDVVIVDVCDGTIVTHPGVGDGTFLAPVVSALDIGGYALETGDFDGDGWPDLAVVSNETFFPPPEELRVGAPPTGATLGFGGGLTIALGRGDGGFETPTPYTVGLFPRAVARGDLDVDGFPDLVVVSEGSFGNDGAVEWLRGQPTGLFADAQTLVPGIGALDVWVDDLTGDGLPDIGTVNILGEVMVLIGNGDGTFRSPQRFGAGFCAENGTVGDFDRDGLLDLATANVCADDLSVLVHR